jgi:uridylate kinase
MDTAAFALAREARLPIIVFSIHKPGSIASVLRGEGKSTLVAA